MNHTLKSFALVLGSCLVMAASASASPSRLVGRQLFQQDCIACHHADGSGGVHFGHGVVSADLRAPGLEATYRHNDALIVRAIRFGKDESGEPLDRPMPHWHKVLSVAQAQDIVAYLHTLKR